MPPIPRTEWLDRLLVALVDEYAKPPTRSTDMSEHESYGVSKRRLGVAAGLLPPEGLDPMKNSAWLQEFEIAMKELCQAGYADYDDGWIAFRPTRAGIDAAKALSEGTPSASARGPKPERIPSMFIGSSVEGLPVAEAIQLGLQHSVETQIWHQGLFGLSGGTLETLVDRLPAYEFAALVLTPDDLRQSRGQTATIPRDNVLFELGLCIGLLGRSRTFIVHRCDLEMDLPSDLAGITPATFALHSDGNLQASVGPVCTQIKLAIQQERATSSDKALQRTAPDKSKRRR